MDRRKKEVNDLWGDSILGGDTADEDDLDMWIA